LGLRMHHSPLLAETKTKSTTLTQKGGSMKNKSRERAYSYVLERDASIARSKSGGASRSFGVRNSLRYIKTCICNSQAKSQAHLGELSTLMGGDRWSAVLQFRDLCSRPAKASQLNKIRSLKAFMPGKNAPPPHTHRSVAALTDLAQCLLARHHHL
jgi:hypothetical protein